MVFTAMIAKTPDIRNSYSEPKYIKEKCVKVYKIHEKDEFIGAVQK
jgi:hypothetical protein